MTQINKYKHLELASPYLVRKYLDIKLKDNDINIVDMIMSYILEECDVCKHKDLDTLNEVDEYDIDCMSECNLPIPENICDGCKIEQICFNCDKFLCPCREDVYDDAKCGAKRCRNMFCDDCKCQDLAHCGDCEEWFCCEPVYQMNGENETIYRCMPCIENGRMGARFNATY